MSTTDCVLSLRVLVEDRHDFRHGLHADNVCLKVFDSEHHDALRDLLRLLRISARNFVLMTGQFSGTETAVSWWGGMSRFLSVNTKVR